MASSRCFPLLAALAARQVSMVWGGSRLGTGESSQHQQAGWGAVWLLDQPAHFKPVSSDRADPGGLHFHLNSMPKGEAIHQDRSVENIAGGGGGSCGCWCVLCPRLLCKCHGVFKGQGARAFMGRGNRKRCTLQFLSDCEGSACAGPGLGQQQLVRTKAGVQVGKKRGGRIAVGC